MLFVSRATTAQVVAVKAYMLIVLAGTMVGRYGLVAVRAYMLIVLVVIVVGASEAVAVRAYMLIVLAGIVIGLLCLGRGKGIYANRVG